ncbi:MAG TPA: hypothetical protein PKY22_00395 [Accumulibacter sp.]|nr:hypothetical protein [Accumulibacter sp.]
MAIKAALISDVSPALSTSQAVTAMKMPIPSATGNDGLNADPTALATRRGLMKQLAAITHGGAVVSDAEITFFRTARAQLSAESRRYTLVKKTQQAEFAHG